MKVYVAFVAGVTLSGVVFLTSGLQPLSFEERWALVVTWEKGQVTPEMFSKVRIVRAGAYPAFERFNP